MAFEPQLKHLDVLSIDSRRRRLIPQSGRDFSSNDYLGLGSSSLLADAARAALDRGVAIGSGGSRLLRGNNEEHEALEADAAAFFGAEAALAFSTGYAANSALFATLPQHGDLIVYDALLHASAHEGMRLGRAVTIDARHNDVAAFEMAIKNWRGSGATGQIWIAVESLYSMDGDQAPLAELMALADRYDAVLIVDEAHATGVFGTNGRGLADALEGRDNVVTLHTMGKALGCEGGLICGSYVVRDFLINRGRGFIFSTAPSPLMAAIGRAALRILRDEPDRRARLWALVHRAEEVLAPAGGTATGSQIIPVILGDNSRTMSVAQFLQRAGFDVRGIRPPTVPDGTSRLRISITLNATSNDVDGLGELLVEALSQ